MAQVDQQKTKRDIVEKGVKSLLLEAKVPMRYHLKVVQALHQAVTEHNKDRAAFRETLAKASQHLNDFSSERQQYHGALTSMAETEKRLKALPHVKGDKGDPGRDGESVEGPAGRDGSHGRTPAMGEVIKAVLGALPTQKAAKEIDHNEIVTKVIKELQKGDKLHIKDIAGSSGFIKDGVKYRFEELMHGGSSGSAGTSFYRTPTGTVNGTNNSFATTGQPSSVIADGIIYFEGSGYSYAANVITMDIPPSQYIRYTL